MFYMLAIRAGKSPVADLELPCQRMSNSAQPKTACLMIALLWTALAATWRSDAATNTFNFSPTTLAAEAGPANPANRAMATEVARKEHRLMTSKKYDTQLART